MTLTEAINSIAKAHTALYDAHRNGTLSLDDIEVAYEEALDLAKSCSYYKSELLKNVL